MTEAIENAKKVAQTRWDQAVHSHYVPESEVQKDEKTGLVLPKTSQKREWKKLPIRLTLEKNKFYGVNLFVDYVTAEIAPGGATIDIEYGWAKLFDTREVDEVYKQAVDSEVEMLLESDVVPEEEEDEEGKKFKLTDEQREERARDIAESEEGTDYGEEVLSDLLSAIADDDKIPPMFREQPEHFWSHEDYYSPNQGKKPENELEWLQPGEEIFLDTVEDAGHKIVVEEGEVPTTLLGYSIAVTEIMERLRHQNLMEVFRKVIPVWSYLRLKYQLKDKNAWKDMSADKVRGKKERLDLMRQWLRVHKLEMSDAARRMLDITDAARAKRPIEEKGKQMTVEGKKAKIPLRFNPETYTEKLLDYYDSMGQDPEVPVDWLIAEGATIDQIWAAADELLSTGRIDPPDYWAITAALSGVDYHVRVTRENPTPSEERDTRKKLQKAITEKHGPGPELADKLFKKLRTRYKDKTDEQIMDMVRIEMKFGPKKNPKELRVELYCGMDESVPQAKQRYKKAGRVAKKHHIQTYFDDFEEHGVRYVDGYIYPTSNNILAVLDDLDRAGVEYDNIDIPQSMKHTTVHKKLQKRYPAMSGVSVNVGDIDEREAKSRKNPSFKNAKEALKDALKHLTTIEVVEYTPYVEPEAKHDTTMEESVAELEQVAKDITAEEQDAAVERYEWQAMFDREKAEHPGLTDEVIKVIVDDHMKSEKRENPASFTVRGKLPAAHLNVEERIVKAFWDKTEKHGPKATPMSETDSTADRRDEVVVHHDSLLGTPGHVSYLLWGHAIARLMEDDRGHLNLGLSTAGWDTMLTNERLGAILSDGQKRYPVLKNFRINKDNGIKLHLLHKLRKIDPALPWKTTEWEEICPIPSTMYSVRDLPKGQMAKYSVYIDLEASVKENVAKLTGKAIRPDIEEMKVPTDTLDEVQAEVDSIEKEILDWRAANNDYTMDLLAASEKLGKRQRYEELLKQRDELMWRGNPQKPYAALQKEYSAILDGLLDKYPKKEAEERARAELKHRRERRWQEQLESLEDIAIVDKWGGEPTSEDIVTAIKVVRRPSELNPKTEYTPKGYVWKDVEVKCPVTGKYTWSCNLCALFLDRDEESIECGAKKGKKYRLAKGQTKTGTTWDTYVLRGPEKKTGERVRAIGGD